MRKKQINTGVAEIILVELPEGIKGITIGLWDNYVYVGGDLNGQDTGIPLGEYKKIKADEVTEEQAEKIVEFGDQEPGNDRYILKWRDYELSKDGVTCAFYDYSFETALESLDSLYEANNIKEQFDLTRTYLLIKK